MTRRPLVLDTSVIAKWYFPEPFSDSVLQLLEPEQLDLFEFQAPDTVLPEFFNTIWQRYRRSEISRDEVSSLWSDFWVALPVSIYETHLLAERAVDICLETRIIIYDALFVSLAVHERTQVLTADQRLIASLRGSSYEQRVVSVQNVDLLLRPG